MNEVIMQLIKQDLKDSFGVVEVEGMSDLEVVTMLIELRKNARLPYNFVIRDNKLEWAGELKTN
jgi:hypothetical protein